MDSKRSIALGSFDGLHRGHKAVIDRARSFARQGHKPCVLLLEPAPAQVLGKTSAKRLMSFEYKRDKLEQLGVEVAVVDFLTVKDMSPADFFETVLCKQLHAASLCCGFNYRFGVKGSGNAELLRELCEKNGVVLNEIEPQTLNGSVVSSTAIRQALAHGEVERAEEMLGHPYGYRFEVVHGDHIGGTVLNCPTINQLFPEEMLVPKYGVYASQTLVDGVWRRSVTNIGCRPSFESNEQRSETHIIDYDGDLYGQHVEVRLCRYKRSERKFDSLEELKQQLVADRQPD
ncbi:MAG TPA: riboflavin biosynthesis protein RibF [Ruminococcaceae bacterium]|nr:riboflavin biosynthesis protein RibF [Oscillospiraceae bacterium]